MGLARSLSAAFSGAYFGSSCLPCDAISWHVAGVTKGTSRCIGRARVDFNSCRTTQGLTLCASGAASRSLGKRSLNAEVKHSFQSIFSVWKVARNEVLQLARW
jgi:hypothetical protein